MQRARIPLAAGLNDNGHMAFFVIRNGADGHFNVLAEDGQKFHKPPDGNGYGLAPQ